MTPQELKASILQLAIQGKLVEQRPEEGTAEELYKQIQEEKKKLIKAGKIKKGKPLPEITEDEIPFDIPESWKWVRIGSLLHKLVDGTHRTPKYTTSGVPFISVRNISNGQLSLKNTKFITEEEHRELWSRCNPQRGDILLSKVGTTGIPAKVDTDREFSLFVSVALLKFNNELLNIDFLMYSILAPDFQKQCKEHTRGVGNKNWVIVDITNTMMPLPPLAEQKRIVAKIEELLPYIDRYEKAWNRLEDLNKRFPADMQKSILQMAIQGKLVEQRPEEGTAEELHKQIQKEKKKLIKEGKIKKEKTLPEITEDEIPFDIPESWMWVRLGDCSSYSQRKEKVNASNITPDMWSLDLEDIEKETGRIIRRCKASERTIAGDKVCFHKGQVLYSKLRPYLKKVLVAPDDGVCSPEMVPFAPYGNIDTQYLVYVLTSPHIDYIINSVTYGVKMPRVGTDTMTNLLIPLPPLAEQKRIVAKLEEILPLCERLK